MYKKCNSKNKFISLKKKNKIILDKGPHYRYVADLWYLSNEIQKKTGYKYVLDIIDDIYIENFGKPKILQVDNGTEFTNNLSDSYCSKNNIKLIHSSPFHPQTNGVCEAVHKEIRKYIYNKYNNQEEEFNIEEELFNITKIHNNKIHSTTKQIPKEIRDIDDLEEIKKINAEIEKTLQAKNKKYDNINSNKNYVFDYNKVYKSSGKIYKKKGKYNKKNICKIPVIALCEVNEGEEYVIEIQKTFKNFKKGDSYVISIELLEEVNNNLWNNLLI